MPDLPLLRRFPGLASLPRAAFGVFPTRVETVAVPGGPLAVKRDDLSGSTIGGNKVRSLEWALGSLRAGEHVVTVGPRGSTHGLATALCARTVGARATVVRWNQEMNDAARRVDAHLIRAATVFDAIWVPAAYSVAASLRLRGARWIAAGGATPRGVLGHVNAALELVEQVARRECELPLRVFVPFGTGASAAGLALGFRIAGVSTRVVGVRVVPRFLGRRPQALRLARAAAQLIERFAGARVPRVGPLDLEIAHSFYGGAYGRPLPGTTELERALYVTGIRLDDTYSRKAFAAAAAYVASAGERAMFWHTFDGRLLA